MSEDDVVDYLVLEAVALKVAKEDDEAMKEAEKESFRKQHGELRERMG